MQPRLNAKTCILSHMFMWARRRTISSMLSAPSMARRALWRSTICDIWFVVRVCAWRRCLRVCRTSPAAHALTRVTAFDLTDGCRRPATSSTTDSVRVKTSWRLHADISFIFSALCVPSTGPIYMNSRYIRTPLCRTRRFLAAHQCLAQPHLRAWTRKPESWD